MATDQNDTNGTDYPTTDDGYPLVPENDVIGIFPDESMWGHRITFEDYDERRVSGHISPRVSEGDLFAYQLESGRIGVFQLRNIDHCLDPGDMFFADAEDIGYLDGFSDERDKALAPSDLPDPVDCQECGAADQDVVVWEEPHECKTKRRIDCSECGNTDTQTIATVGELRTR